jgi:lipopolysaccharide/colanic/teichoic acid biosynthesis glycosyltransferase
MCSNFIFIFNVQYPVTVLQYLSFDIIRKITADSVRKSLTIQKIYVYIYIILIKGAVKTFQEVKYMKIVHENVKSITFPTKINSYFYYKHLMEILISIAALVVFFPIILVISILIRSDSNGPIFFIQERIGQAGKPFNIIKFRTMYMDAEKYGPQWANKDDLRITRVGYFLRKHRLDEIPQFINVIKGEMSLIGPRPERMVFVKEFESELPHFRERLKVKPGITGWAQINGGYELSPEEKLKLDLFYIEKLSFLLDIKIAIQSILVILFAKGWR